ncbi:FAD-binding oxidoreductase [Kineococcus radiotolerans]|uniref:FAD-binding oxidoreductase n=1 Tax=Kineococcus radiotolerans TaxID=131568 RepID=UPI001C846FE2|nr:FAD-binding oxidoreductase [Kineococcus radiotolerans]
MARGAGAGGAPGERDRADPGAGDRLLARAPGRAAPRRPPPAPDGYRAVRSYSIASAALGPGPAEVEIGVELLPDGEVSSFLTGEVRAGDVLEVTGPLGGWFVWRPGDPGPVQLVGGGSGVVPLVSGVRTHAAVPDPPPLRLGHEAGRIRTERFGSAR